jgi:hypothetical protein
VEGGGLVTADTLHIITDLLQLDKSSILRVSGRGLLDGPGVGLQDGGAGHGGRGLAGGVAGTHPGDIYGSLYYPDAFGSGGAGASNSTGRGKVLVKHISFIDFSRSVRIDTEDVCNTGI